jgi:hypothetical protein
MKFRTLMIAVGLAGFVVTVLVPNLIQTRGGPKYASRAMGALRSIATSQSIFREGDKDADGVPDYATLSQLGATQLVDGLLASGTKSGYLFRSEPSSSTPELLWWATAEPMPAIQERGWRRYFAMNQGGTICWSLDVPIAIDPVTCAIDTRMATELGR